MGLLEDVANAVNANSLVRAVDIVPRGHVRIQTALLYPDGSSIDIFLAAQKRGDSFLLTDFGRSIEQLLDLQIKPWESPTRVKYLEDALVNFGVNIEDAALVYLLPSLEQLTDGVLRLGQACIRVSDLIYTKRVFGRRASFKEEVLDVIDSAELPYRKGVEVDSRFGKKVRLDYRVDGTNGHSLVQTLSSKNHTESQNRAARVFAKWYDIGEAPPEEQRLTIYDDVRMRMYRDEDLRRLEQVSKLIAVSSHDEIQRTLRQAA